MFGAMLDRIGGALGRPDNWERRTKAAVLDAHDIITVPSDRPGLLTASACRFEPAVAHAPTGWLIALPAKGGWRRLGWMQTGDGRLVLEAGALREGVWLQTRILEAGAMPLEDTFAARASAILEAAGDIVDLVRTPPGDDGVTPRELRLTFDRNGAPQTARLLMLGVKDHVIEVTYEAPLRLAGTAAALADAAVALGLESAFPPEPPQSTPEEMAEAMRAAGMSEDEIAEVLGSREATAP